MTPARDGSARRGSAGARNVVPGGRPLGTGESTSTRGAERGLSVVELLFALAASVTVGALAMAATGAAIDEMRTAVAARYIAGRIGAARIDAVRRASAVALRFEAVDGDYVYTPYEDGNGNGVRTAEIRDGVDRPVGTFERLADKFPGVRFELASGVPDADGQPATGADGVRIGAAGILTLSPDGTATSGTLYVRGRRGQYAVRILGVTGRTRMLQYQPGNRAWLSR
jgi:Tfp pilus assembly protein FimT